MTLIDVPEEVRLRAEASGEATRRWLADLPNLVSEFERAWEISVAREALQGGSASYLARATQADGRPAILKLTMPGEDMAGEILVLQRADGRGYGRLFRHDASRSALLMEPLGPSVGSLSLPADQQMRIICATLAKAWVPAHEAPGLMTGAEKARWLTEFIARTWEELDRPCSEAAVAQALAYAEARATAFDPERCVIVHDDAHAGNTLQAAAGYKFVDPDGLLAEPACDLAVPMREWSGELLAGDPLDLGRARCAMLADLTGVDPQAIWEWGMMERVSTGLLCVKLGYQPIGRETLAVADAWAVSR